MLRQWSLVIVSLVLVSCGKSSLQSSSSTSGSAPRNYTLTLTGSNVLPVQVSPPSSYSWTASDFNIPYVTVKICTPGHTDQCALMSSVLVDTGSYGLRIFNSSLTSTEQGYFPAVLDGSNNAISECAEFGSGNTWGPVVTADVYLAGESVVRTPIQLVNETAVGYENCSSAALLNGPFDRVSTQFVDFNGILGVGIERYDFGPYYSCYNSSCAQISGPSKTIMLQNPVFLFSKDSNGLIFELPYLSSQGTTTVNGSVVFGIGTQSNNIPSGVQTYLASSGAMTTGFAGQSVSTILDSGSNAMYFNSSLTHCSGSLPGVYCPLSLTTLSATLSSGGGNESISTTFQVQNGVTLWSTGDLASALWGGPSVNGDWIWGLPFFYGRKIYVGYDGQSSSLGTGPYWAFW